MIMSRANTNSLSAYCLQLLRQFLTRRIVTTPGLLIIALFCIVGCDFPPMNSEQQGFRGTGIAQINNPEDIALLATKNQVPDELPVTPPAPGPRASEIYENVQVLGDLSATEFIGVMTAITQWVAPEQGCTYCHEAGNFVSDDMYTKVVSRRMLEMTRNINTNWTSHVGDTGVTCYTCHRGNPVPEYIWFEGTDKPDTKGMAASRLGQNLASASVGSASLPYDPFSPLIGSASQDGQVKVASATALPVGETGSMADTEKTYALMMHMSGSLGVNCTYCHNSRAFSKWDQSSPARVTAWHGIRMAQELNHEYLSPLQNQYPAERLGLTGDAPKANCSTCHQGVAKPLYGEYSEAASFPALYAQSAEADIQTTKETGMEPGSETDEDAEPGSESGENAEPASESGEDAEPSAESGAEPEPAEPIYPKAILDRIMELRTPDPGE